MHLFGEVFAFVDTRCRHECENLRSLTFERRTCYETFLRQVVSSSLLPFLLTFGDSMASASELPVDVLIAGSGGDKSEDAGKKHSHRESGTPSGDGSDDGSDDRNDDENDVAYDSDAGHSGSGQAPFSSEDEDALRACCDKRSVEQSCIVWMSGEKQHLCRALQVSPASHQEEWEGCRKSSYKVEPSKKEEKKMQAELHKQETDRLMSVNCVFGELQFLTLGISRLIPSYLLASWTSAMTSFTFSALECHLPQVRLHSFIYIDPLGLTRLRCDLIWWLFDCTSNCVDRIYLLASYCFGSKTLISIRHWAKLCESICCRLGLNGRTIRSTSSLPDALIWFVGLQILELDLLVSSRKFLMSRGLYEDNDGDESHEGNKSHEGNEHLSM